MKQADEDVVDDMTPWQRQFGDAWRHADLEEVPWNWLSPQNVESVVCLVWLIQKSFFLHIVFTLLL